MTPTFEYLGHTFQPLGKLPATADFLSINRKLKRLTPPLHNYDGGRYEHRRFYEFADQIANAGQTDIFLMNDEMTVLPCENELFEYHGDYTNGVNFYE